jgi:hypothetical protein
MAKRRRVDLFRLPVGRFAAEPRREHLGVTKYVKFYYTV